MKKIMKRIINYILIISLLLPAFNTTIYVKEAAQGSIDTQGTNPIQESKDQENLKSQVESSSEKRLSQVFSSIELNQLGQTAKQTAKRQEEKQDRYIVKYTDVKKSISANQNKKKYGLIKHAERIESSTDNMEVVVLKDAYKQEEALERLKEASAGEYEIEYIVPDTEVYLYDYKGEPFLEDKDFQRTDSPVKKSGQYLTASELQQQKTTSSSISEVVVAILDSDVDTNHPDLKRNLWNNPNEIKNDKDEDGNGYIDDVSGWDFVNRTPLTNSKPDVHGTHIAGVIAAERGNAVGIDGIASNARIMPLTVFQDGKAYTSSILEAIAYAEKNGADIVNISWGTNVFNVALRDAIKNSPLLFVCAAGNSSQNIDVDPVYPASFACDNVIAVASIGLQGGISSYSNYGPNTIEVAAIGEGVLSTLPDNTYGIKSGTSIAVPNVTATAALLLGEQKELAAFELKRRLIEAATAVPELENKIEQGNCLLLHKTKADSKASFPIIAEKEKEADTEISLDTISSKGSDSGVATGKEGMLSWLKKQQDQPSYNVKITFNKDYSYDYTGEVEGKIEPASFGSETWEAYPYIDVTTDLIYNEPMELHGIWKHIDCPKDYKIAIYDQSDIEYLVKTVPLQSDGSWDAGNVTIRGRLRIYLMSSEGHIVAKPGDNEVRVSKEYEIQLYSTSDIPYLQARLPLREDGIFVTQPDPIFYEAYISDIVGYTTTMHTGTKVARVVSKTTGEILSSTEIKSYDLIRSYVVPVDDPYYNISLDTKSWIYDDALAVIAFSMAGNKKRASDILASLSELQETDGSLQFVYDIYSGKMGSVKRSGAIAWVGYAALLYERYFDDSSYRGFIQRIAKYLLNLQDKTTGSIKGGPDVAWFSTEHNIDAYFFFRDLYEVTQEKVYLTAALDVKRSLLENHWNGKENRFNQGIGDPSYALDTSSWGGIFLHAIGENSKAELCYQTTGKFLLTNRSMPLSALEDDYNMTYTTDKRISGFKPYLQGEEYGEFAPDIIWSEGTFGVIDLGLRLGKEVDGYMQSMDYLQSGDPEGGLVYANKGYAPYPFEFHVWPGVAGTAWGYMTLSDHEGFWEKDSESFKQAVKEQAN